MEKINGVTMDGHTVVDIDRNADEVVIPEYAKDTTYQLPLYGIKSMEVSDLMLLAQFAGLPKRLVLNDKGNLASYSLSYWCGLSKNLQKTTNQLGYNACFKKCEKLKGIEIPARIKEIPNMMFFGCRELSEVVFHDGLEVIGASAFASCRNLEKINLRELLGN